MTAAKRKLVFAYLFAVYFLAGAAETYISPLFPLMRHDLHLVVSDQATLIAALTICIAIGNVAGGWIGNHHGDRWAVRTAALLYGIGCLISGSAASFATIGVGQVLSGLGVGVFFAPGLSIIGRMYPTTRGRAIASYGLAYSSGLAAAAFAASLGTAHWRWAFIATGALALGFLLLAPALPEAEGEPSTGLLRDALAYARNPMWRAALAVGVVAGMSNYIVIGLTPEHFVNRGSTATFVGAVVGGGRIASMLGKYVSGWMLDRVGGPRTAQFLMLALIGFGLAELAVPGTLGMWAVAPVVCVTAMLFPVSNAMVVIALPQRSSWGVGIYRAGLMLFSAVCAAVSGAALHAFSTTPVMLASLAIPVIVVLAQGRHAWSKVRLPEPAAPVSALATGPIQKASEAK